MKVKELQKTVNVAWSPVQLNSVYLAAGTAAQQFDATNGNNSVLEIYSANLSDPGYDMTLLGSQSSHYRFQKIVWSPTGINAPHGSGLIVGGCESGHLQIYSAAKLLAGEESLIAHQEKHTGAISGLDFNPFQHNLLASVASESELFIWDLNNTSTPMNPGTKTQPLEDIKNVAWNKQVQHILSTVFSSRCVIWDLRKNEQVIKLSDTQSRVRWRAIQWHPEIATQLWLASEEDQAPFVQLWDLRYATAPTKTLQIHQRGMLGLTWCPKDSDLMVSCGKDNKIICWNPNSDLPGGEILSEVATTVQWYSDVQWCPRNPALIASSSLDGNVSIYSLSGGSQQQIQTSNKIADSFPGMDQMAQTAVPQLATQTVYADLKKPPKWMKKPAGASFGFGGRLITFGQKHSQKVNIQQVVTEPDLIAKSSELEETLSKGDFVDYCRQKADKMADQHGRYLWYFLKANFENNPKEEMLNLLGYDKNDMSKKFEKYAEAIRADENSVEQITNQMAALSRSDSSEVEGDQSTDDSTDLSGVDNNALFDAIAAGNKNLEEQKNVEYPIKTGDDSDGLICQAIISGNIEAAVELCLEADKPAEAIIIALTGGSELLAKTQTRYLKKTDGYLSNVISALVTQDWENIVSQCTVDSWKEALVACLTHSHEQAAILCEKLGDRLLSEHEKDPSLAKNAIFCYICSGNLEKLVNSWISQKKNGNESDLSNDELQDIIEIIMLVQKAFEIRGRNFQPTGKLAELLSRYAGFLAAQGALSSALFYMCPSEDPLMQDLRERLYYALGHKVQQANYAQANVKYNQQNVGYNTQLSNQSVNRFAQQRGSFSSGMPPMPTPATNFNTSLPSMYKPNEITQPQSWAPPSLPAQPVPSFNPPPASSNVMPPPAAVPTLPNDGAPHPQRPPSVGSQGATPLSRVKYVLDPSVASGPNYGQTTNFYSPTLANNNNYSPQSLAPNPTLFNTQSLANANPLPYPGAPVPTQPQSAAGPLQGNFKPFVANPTMSNPGPYLNNGPPIEVAQQAAPQPPLPTHKSSAPGWNDPPAIRSSRPQVQYNDKKEMSAQHAGTRKWQQIINSHPNSSKQRVTSSNSTQDTLMFQRKSESSQSVNPITHPLFGVDPNQNQNGYPDPNAGYGGQFQGPPMQSHMPQQANILQPQQTMPLQQQQAFPPQMNYQNQQSQMYTSQPEIAAPSKVEPVKEKPPLPEEYVYLQVVLDELKNQCLNSTTDARTKRKFTDVAKRLENLYDNIRENKLSQNTIASLCQIVQCVQVGDYHNALVTYTAIVSGPDFSQTANFMPGIKVLLQSANELKVYLR